VSRSDGKLFRLANTEETLRSDSGEVIPPSPEPEPVKQEVSDEELERAILAMFDNAGSEGLDFGDLYAKIGMLDWGGAVRIPTLFEIMTCCHRLVDTARIEACPTLDNTPAFRRVAKAETPDFQLTPSPSDVSKKRQEVLKTHLLKNYLKGNRYLPETPLATVIAWGNASVAPEDVVAALESLVKDGAAKKAKSATGVWMYKKAYTRTRRAMRKGEWKTLIVEVLDSRPGIWFSHSGILAAIKVWYPEKCANVDVHGCVGSALDRLVKDGKFKRIRTRTVYDGSKLYSTAPIEDV